MPPEIAPQKIDEIIRCPDPVLRNLQITQTYCDINLALSELLGKKNVSWCAYATWASKTAGKFIRLESVDAAIVEFLRDQDWIQEIRSALPGAMTWFGWKVKINTSFLIKILNETAEAMAKEVAGGNLLVFSELAPLYAQFLQIISAHPEQRDTELQAFLAYLQQSQIAGENQNKLAQAYTAYQSAVFEPDNKTRSELIFMANVLIGYHEQMRLNPAINNSLNAPVEQIFKKKMLGGLELLIEATLPGWLFNLSKPLLQNSLQKVVDQMASNWRRISTRLLMRIEVPNGHLALSEDIPLIEYQPGKMFPVDLEDLQNPHLIALLKELDHSPDSTRGSAAKDWGNLGERMNFIADFFRSAQQDEHLFWQPFNREQTIQIKKGLVPAGKL